MRFSRRAVVLSVSFLLLIAISLVFAPVWLTGMAHFLILDEQPRKSDAILVLAGDYKGERIQKACELAKAGFAPVVLVDGPFNLYGKNEADLAIDFAEKSGCPASLMQPVYINAFSTDDEAREVKPQILARQVRTLTIVTSNYHTARAARIFRRYLGHNIEVHMVAAPDSNFDPDGWWRAREGRKTIFYEMAKTLSGPLGL